jgi:hypothetical protein
LTITTPDIQQKFAILVEHHAQQAHPDRLRRQAAQP